MSSKILVVDDERAIRMAVRDSLSREGYFAITACSGEEAIRRCKSEHFDLLITDLKMPGMSGLELIRGARDILPDIRTIIMTAYASTDSAVEALRLGVSDYIVKPFRLAELRCATARLIEHITAGPERDSIGPDAEQEFRYRFGSDDNALTISGSTISRSEKETLAACDAVRTAARALALYAKKNGTTIDPTIVAEAISDMLYFEHRSPVDLQCENAGGNHRVSAAIRTRASDQPPSSSVASPSAGSFPGLRAAVFTHAAGPTETETKTTTLEGSRAEFVDYNCPPPQTVSIESGKVDLKYLVEQVESAARTAGLNSVRTNDIVAAVNEAVLNSIEHGYGRRGSGKVDVRWSVFAGEIVATVKDYGEGFDPDAVAEGGGFAAFKRLADRVAIESAPGLGTTVYLAKAAQ